ncbi:hypothetical protein SOVF_142260 [Spinacia oleracea]|nr:hypothetical protein SOVF_142260 [Spinacia oleracea]
MLKKNTRSVATLLHPPRIFELQEWVDFNFLYLSLHIFNLKSQLSVHCF